jgi:hypothetical protein
MKRLLLLLLIASACHAQGFSGKTSVGGKAGFGGGFSASAGITIVQHQSATCAAANTCALAFGSNNASGNLLIYVSAFNSGSTGQLSAATDSNSNTIANAKLNDTTQGALRVDCVNSSNSGANTVTAHNSATQRLHIHIWEVSGMNSTACTALDASNTGIQTATSQSISTSAGTAHANDLVFGAFYDFTNNSSLTAGSGFNPSNFTDGGAGDESALSESKVVSSTGTQTATATCGSGTDRVLQIVIAFKGT